MTKLIFLPHIEICPEGAVFEVEPGISICDAALAHGIEIHHACDRSCACTTCHVILRAGDDSLVPAEELEEDILDQAWGLARVTPELPGGGRGPGPGDRDPTVHHQRGLGAPLMRRL